MSQATEVQTQVAGHREDAQAQMQLTRPRESEARRRVIIQTLRAFDSERLSGAFSIGPVEHRLLGPGSFQAHLLRIDMAEFALDFVRYSRPVTINGRWRPGCVALAFGLSVPNGMVALGHAHHAEALTLLDDATGIDGRLPAWTEWAMLTLRCDRFVAEVRRRGGEAALARMRTGLPLHVPEPERRRLRHLLRAVGDRPAITSQSLQRPGFTAALEEDLLAAYLEAFIVAQRPQPMGRGTLQRRYRLVRMAEHYVFAHLDDSIRMAELCRAIGTSARSLEYASRSIYGMGAMEYLRTVRLNEVRKALLQAGRPAWPTVTAAAMYWGFWHLGEFAAAYRRLFGETPSETLRSSLRGVRGGRADVSMSHSPTSDTPSLFASKRDTGSFAQILGRG